MVVVPVLNFRYHGIVPFIELFDGEIRCHGETLGDVCGAVRWEFHVQVGRLVLFLTGPPVNTARTDGTV